MNTREIEYITTIADFKSLTKAAAYLYVTPSALTQQVVRLEKELGTELFVRSRNGWTPTEAGEIYIEAARRMLEIKKSTYKRIQDFSTQKNYTISIGVPPERGTHIFSAVYPVFMEKYPEVKINLFEQRVRVLQQMIEHSKLDIAIMTLVDSQKTDDSYILLREEEILLAVPRNYSTDQLCPERAQKGSPYPVVSLDKVSDQPFALISNSSTFRKLQDDIFSGYGIRPIQNFETTRTTTVLDMVSLNLCCGLVSEFFVKNLKTRKAKIYALPEHPHWSNVASFRKGKYLSEAEKYFIELVKKYLDGDL